METVPRKPRVFVASSSESLDVADAINVNLEREAEVTVWKHGFKLSTDTMTSLVTQANSSDFAIFVFTPDDEATIRDESQRITRDNVVFELGLFAGTLGIKRCFIIKPRGEALHLPSDLLGLTVADYDGNRSDGNLDAAVNAPCALIRKEIAEKGMIQPESRAAKAKRKTIKADYTLAKTEYRILLETLSAQQMDPNGAAVIRVFDCLEKEAINLDKLPLASEKLIRLGLLAKSNVFDPQDGYPYYAFTVTRDGIDYLLENEKTVNQYGLKPEKPKPVSDIPF